MDKVYCKNCKFKGWIFCKRPELQPKKNPYHGQREGFLPTMEKFNNEGTCSHYKKRWWYFWIK